jgi:hypothetical protein
MSCLGLAEEYPELNTVFYFNSGAMSFTFYGPFTKLNGSQDMPVFFWRNLSQELEAF